MGLNKPPPKKGGGTTPPTSAVQKKPPEKPIFVTSGSGRVTLSSGKAKTGTGIMALLKNKGKPSVGTSPGENADERIEDSVFSLIRHSNFHVPALFSEYLQKISSKITLGNTSRMILEAFSNIDVTAEKVGQCLNANAYYQEQFLRVIESLSKREQMPAVETAVVLLGMQSSRNLIVALQMVRSINMTHPERTKDGKLGINPPDLLKYATKTEEALTGDKNGYADTAYSAGLVYDFFNLMAQEIAADKKKAIAYIEEIYNHGLKTAQVALEIANRIPDFGFKKFIFSACLIHDIGKIPMAILDADYLGFVEDCRKKGLSRQIRVFAEEQRFGVSHALLGCLTCHYFKIFKPIAKAILYHHDPYLLRNRSKNYFQLTSLICLSTNICNNFKVTERSDDPVVSLWKGRELEGFKIDFKDIRAALSRLSRK